MSRGRKDSGGLAAWITLITVALITLFIIVDVKARDLSDFLNLIRDLLQ